MKSQLKDADIATAVAQRLGIGLDAEEVWLFGSQARGDASQDSDHDFLVVVTESPETSYRLAREAHSLVSGIRLPKDIIVLTRRQWARQENVVNTLPYIAKKEGRILYHR